MAGIRTAVMGLALMAASYAWAGPPEAYLGGSLARGGGAKPAASRASAALALAGATADDPAVGAYARALGGLAGQTRATTRGAKESEVYRQAAASVLLIVTDKALGSGILISADGQIVTNLHVVEGFEEVGVIFKPAQEGADLAKADVHRARVLRRDEVADLALIQVSELPAHVKPIAISVGGGLEVGSDVHAIGHPTGEAWTYTRGIVSQIRRDYAWTTEDRLKHQANVIQTQTPINPGNSGGPLIDDNLQVVGVNSFKGEGEGLNFAVSAEDVRAFLARTGDRVADRIGKAPTRTATDGKACKSEALEERPSKEPVGTEFLIDTDCDGKGDYVSIIPDSAREPIVVMLDSDGDGKLDTVIFDKGHDGHPDSALYDTDNDGKFDLEGKYRRGESEPYRFERISG